MRGYGRKIFLSFRDEAECPVRGGFSQLTDENPTRPHALLPHRPHASSLRGPGSPEALSHLRLGRILAGRCMEMCPVYAMPLATSDSRDAHGELKPGGKHLE